MREHHARMDKRMFDFEDFYADVATRMCYKGARLAEVGVADGASAIYLAEALLNQEKQFRLILVDNLAYGGAEQLKELTRNLADANLFPWVEILPMDSLNASCKYPDGFFDFVFIDASHEYEHTKADIRLWWHKVKDGGILAGHDYYPIERDEVQRAVDAVIPPDAFSVYPTTEGYGVWWLEKDPNIKMR